MSFQTGYEAARDREALVISEIDGSSSRCTFAELSARSSQLATWLTAQGVSRGDRVMLNNQLELWECMLACIKGGFVLNPATTMLGTADLQDRTDRANISWVVANAEDTAKFQDVAGDFAVIQVGDEPDAQSTHRTLRYSESYSGPAEYTPTQPTRADESLLLYFTSGTTSKAKLVDHTHTSYPVGHLTTMYGIGLAPGDVHLNVAAPGWAKHAWSNFFAPWIAGATVFCYNYSRFDAVGLMDTMEAEGVTSACAPPTVWRMLIQTDLTRMKNSPTKLAAAGEPLNPELIVTIERAWKTSVRDGFGQTETTLQIANTPGQKVKPRSMGRPLPGREVALIDPATDEIAERDEDGFIFYIGRADDVFKASDYRLSPFELESVVIEHAAVAEVAVVPSPDPIRLAVPKAYVALAPGHEPTAEVAESILRHCRDGLAPYKRIRRLEFYELPKTISGKIRRVELRKRENEIHAADGGQTSASTEYADADFPDLKG